MRIKRSKQSGGFTLIEILIAMVIFGFLIYIITSLLIVIINTVFSIQMKAYLRNDMENIISVVTDDLQFAGTPSYCAVGNNQCITFTVQVPTANGGSELQCETIELVKNGNLSNIVKVVTINGSSTCPLGSVGSKTYYLNAANTTIPTMYFDIEQGNVLFTMTGQVDDRYGKPIFSNGGLPEAANIQFSKK